MELGIHNRKALICAASKGLGRATAYALAAEGVEVFLCARGEEALRTVALDIERQFGRSVPFQVADLSVTESRETLIQAVSKQFGTLDILVHNVGGPPPTNAEETTLAQWEAGFHQLFQSVVHLNQAFIPGMKAQGWGRVITVTSTAVLEPIAGLAISNGLRAGVTAMLKTLSDELAPFNVTINCVAPGIIHTDRTEERVNAAIAKSGGSREAYLESYLKGIPMRRFGNPEEFADAVAFLASERASYITGTTLSVDGGKRRAAI